MSTHDGGVDHHVLVVVIAGQQLENTVENPALRPSAETLMDRFPVAETLGQIPPGTSSPKAIENPFDQQSNIFGGGAPVFFTTNGSASTAPCASAACKWGGPPETRERPPERRL